MKQILIIFLVVISIITAMCYSEYYLVISEQHRFQQMEPIIVYVDTTIIDTIYITLK